MIEVSVTEKSVVVSGHACYAEIGKDIVCAAVSALTQNLMRGLDSLTSDIVICAAREGHMDIEYEDLSERGKLLVDSFFIGICDIANNYPEYLKIN